MIQVTVPMCNVEISVTLRPTIVWNSSGMWNADQSGVFRRSVEFRKNVELRQSVEGGGVCG